MIYLEAKFFQYGFAMAAVLFVSGCSSFGIMGAKSRSHTVVVDQDVTLTDAAGKKISVKAKEEVSLENGSVFVEAPGYIGVLIAPVSPNPKNSSISLRPYSSWSGESFENLIDEKLTEAMNLVTKVQALMINQKWELALAELQSGQQKFPYLTYFKFLEASCYSMMGRSQEAQVSLKSALERRPASVEGRKLFRSLTGKDYKP